MANTVSVLTNGGDGSFAAKLDYQTGRGPESIAIGDLNGDGKPDVAVANYSADTVSVLLNRGDGSFEVGREYATGSTPASVAIGDLNGDGKQDLAIANFGMTPRTTDTSAGAQSSARRSARGVAAETTAGRPGYSKPE